MASLGAAAVQRSPFRIPVKWNTVGSLAHIVQGLHIFKLDASSTLMVKQAKRDFVFGIRLRKEVFKGCPIGQVQLARLASVGNIEQDSVLVAFDLVL